MFSENARGLGVAVARLALVTMIGTMLSGGVGGCRERVVVGTEPSEEQSAALPDAPDAGPDDVADPPGEGGEGDEGDESDEDDDAANEDTDEDAQDEDAQGEMNESADGD